MLRPFLVLLALLAPPALAEASVLDVTAEAMWPVVPRGGEQRASCRVGNAGAEPFVAQATVRVAYADGREEAILRMGHPVLLGPGDAVTYAPAFTVPEDAALGPATITCSGRAAGARGGAEERSEDASFLVTPP